MTQAEYLQLIDSVNEKGVYKPDWSSLANHKTPEWYYRDKFGIFIHWGLYSVPAYLSEWYSRMMYDPESREFEYHIKNYGSHKTFGYKDFIPMFKAENFDAKAWVELFKQSGARFVMPVCEHHDGFAMYETEFNRWNAKEMGPCRDIAGELRDACDEKGLTFCASTHRAEHFFFMNMGRTIESDVNDENYRDFYGPAVYCPEFHGNVMHDTTAQTASHPATKEWLEDWLVRTCELIDRYRPKILYFDWWIHNQCFKPYLKKLCAYYYNRALEWGTEVTINYKHEAFPPSVATFDVERGALTDISPVPWQTDTAIGKNSWGYTKDNQFKGARQIICDLIDIVSKNGMLLLNIGPKPDGTITAEETKVLMDIGKWMADNSEGIYGTIPWKQYGEGDVNVQAGFFMDGEEKAFTEKDFRFTYKDGCIYVYWMRPSTQTASIKTLAARRYHDFPFEKVEVLGNYSIETVNRIDEALEITLDHLPENTLPICFKVTLD